MKIKHQIKKIQQQLNPALLSPKWRKLVPVGSHPTTGHCYVAAEALWHMQGVNRVVWQPMFAVYIENGERCTHWWLQHKQTQEIADPTREQYLPEAPPYHLGRKGGFLTLTPSKRACTILSIEETNTKP